MERIRINSWLFPTLICVALSVVYMFEWRANRDVQQANLAAFTETVQAVSSELSLESTQTRSVLNSIREAMRSMAERQGVLARTLTQGDPQLGASTGSTEQAEMVNASSGEYVDPLAISDVESHLFPPVPEGVNSVPTVESLDLNAFCGDPLFNPNEIALSPVEFERASNLVTHAKARLSTLRSDLHLFLLEVKPELLEQNMFIDYAMGQKRDSMKGVYTMGELLPAGGMRIFPYPSDEYPEVYEIQEEMRSVADGAMRRLLAVIESAERR